MDGKPLGCVLHDVKHGLRNMHGPDGPHNRASVANAARQAQSWLGDPRFSGKIISPAYPSFMTSNVHKEP